MTALNPVGPHELTGPLPDPAELSSSPAPLGVSGIEQVELPVTPESELHEQTVESFLAQIATGSEVQGRLNQIEAAALYVSPSFTELLKKYSKEHEITATESLEQKGYAKEAPRFGAQVNDESRAEPFFYFQDGVVKPKAVKMRTEHQGLAELYGFLKQFTKITANSDLKRGSDIDMLSEYAKSMLENLTFIGDKELSEASIGIGRLWRSYLDGDSKRQICVLTEAGNIKRYAEKGARKSDEYLREQVMSRFTQKQRHRYKGRIVTSLEELSGDPENTRLVLLDDWTVSGAQMRSTYNRLYNNDLAKPYLAAGCLEINVVAAPADRIERGLQINPYKESRGFIKVRSYFRAHDAPVAVESGQAHITGLHSSVNYGFRNTLRDMKSTMSKLGIHTNPALAHVAPVYKYALPNRLPAAGSRLKNIVPSARK